MIVGMTQRAREAFSRKWVLFIRQSSWAQRDFNPGSGDVQAKQMRYVERMNVRPDQVVTIDARGETGRAHVVREQFNVLLTLVESGAVGVLVLARLDRLGRNSVDSARVLAALAKHRGVLLVDGDLYDPRRPVDLFSLGLLSNSAEFENNARSDWLQRTRLEVARARKLAVPLPTGLTWADHKDPYFLQKLEEAGLTEWTDRADEHRAVVQRPWGELRVFPYPDRAVYDAAQLRMQWLLETQDLAEVRARIRDRQSGWPRRGEIPLVRSRVFSTHSKIEWVGVEYIALAMWYRSLALYTIYGYEAHTLAEGADDATASAFAVRVPRAFPSFAEPEDLPRVEELLARAQGKPWKASVPVRDHLLPNVRCAVPYRGGPCGRHMTGTGSGTERRYGTFCRHPNPNWGASHLIEEPVIEVMLAALGAEEIKRSVDSLRLDRSAVLKRYGAAQEEVARLKAEAEAALDMSIKAGAKKQRGVAARLLAKHVDLTGEKEEAERTLELVRGEEGEIRAVTDADYARVLALAADLPGLVERARAEPLVLRRLIGELIRAVHVKPLAHGVLEVEVEFPTGVRVRRVVETDPAVSSQPQRVYAVHRLEGGASAGEVADELNGALPKFLARTPTFVRFSARRVETLRAMHVHGGDVLAREGEGLTAVAIAQRYGVPEADALEAVLLGHLGPASWAPERTLAVVPTEAELAWSLPAWGRRRVAEEHGWPVEDTGTIREVGDALGLSREEVLSRVGRCSGAVALPARRLWVRRSEAADPEGAYHAAMRAARPDLDPIWWVLVSEAVRMVGASRNTIHKTFPCARPVYGTASEGPWYAWLHPDLVAERMPPDLARAVENLGAGYDVQGFLPLMEVVQELNQKFGIRAEWSLREAVRLGRVTSVVARHNDRKGLQTTYLLVPAEIRAATDLQDVRRWFLGRERER